MTHKPIDDLGENLARFGDSPQSLEAALNAIAVLQAKNEALEKEVASLKFGQHLDKCSETVKSWPEWKQAIWGPSEPMKAAIKHIEELEELCLCLEDEKKTLEAQAAAMRAALEFFIVEDGWIEHELPDGTTVHEWRYVDCPWEQATEALANDAGKELFEENQRFREFYALVRDYSKTERSSHEAPNLPNDLQWDETERRYQLSERMLGDIHKQVDLMEQALQGKGE